MIPALKKFRLVAVVLGSENPMKAIPYLHRHDVWGSLEAHPDSSGAGEWAQNDGQAVTETRMNDI